MLQAPQTYRMCRNFSRNICLRHPRVELDANQWIADIQLEFVVVLDLNAVVLVMDVYQASHEPRICAGIVASYDVDPPVPPPSEFL